MESKLSNYQPLSHSRRSKFEECPRAFSFSYLEKIPQTDNIYAGIGTFVHSVIEDFYSDPKNPNPRNYTGMIRLVASEVYLTNVSVKKVKSLKTF